MNKERIAEEWKHLKNKWDLQDWKLNFSNGKRQLGHCNCKKKIISLSNAYIKTNPYDILRDTLLHEIAHAIQFKKTGKTDHGPRWKTIAKKVGCTAQRCVSSEDIEVPRGKYVGVCPSCKSVTHFYRKVKRKYSCRLCSNKYSPEFRLNIISIEEYESF